MSFLSLGPAVFATQTTFGWLFGWRPAVDGQNPANNAVVSPIKNSIPSTVLSHIYIYIYRLFPSWTLTKVSWEDVPLHHRGGAGSVPHLCHRHVDRNVLDVWAFQISSFQVLSKEFSKKQINWFGFKSFGIIFLDTFFWFAIERPKNCQPPTKNRCHGISSNPLVFFWGVCQVSIYATFCYVILFDKCSLCNGCARAQVGRSFTVTRHVWGKDLLVNFTLCRSVLSNRGDLLGIFEGFLKKRLSMLVLQFIFPGLSLLIGGKCSGHGSQDLKRTVSLIFRYGTLNQSLWTKKCSHHHHHHHHHHHYLEYGDGDAWSS